MHVESHICAESRAHPRCACFGVAGLIGPLPGEGGRGGAHSLSKVALMVSRETSLKSGVCGPTGAAAAVVGHKCTFCFSELL